MYGVRTVHTEYRVHVVNNSVIIGIENQTRLRDSAQLGPGTPCRPCRQASCMVYGLCTVLYKTASGLADVGYWIFSSTMQHSERGFK